MTLSEPSRTPNATSNAMVGDDWKLWMQGSEDGFDEQSQNSLRKEIRHFRNLSILWGFVAGVVGTLAIELLTRWHP